MTDNYMYTFTVFTPTYNRAYTLPMVYESLKKQTFRDFEWLIVDDGSTDNTKKLVETWQKEAELPIRYFWQKNGGKHRARNFGVSQAHGAFFFTLDSDDEIVSNVLERFYYQWNRIPKDQRSQFAGVAGLCVNHKGSIIGSRFPRDIFDSNMWEIRDKYKVTGEKCGFQRTDVMKEFPFPEFVGEKYVREGIVWYRIAQKYRTRFVNEILRIYEKLPDGLSVSSLIHTIHNPRGTALFSNEYLSRRSSFPKKLKAAVNYISCSLHAKKNIFEVINNASLPLFAVIAIPVGYLFYLIDRYRYTI